MRPSPRWRQLIDERLGEVIHLLGRAEGVHGLIVAGSLGRGEPWPMSDIDILPIYTHRGEPEARLDERRAELVDWWAGSGRAQTLDVGWLSFTVAEARAALSTPPSEIASRIATDARWFHALDKAYGGRAGVADELTGAFVEWITAMRFEPVVVAARIEAWRAQAASSLEAASGAGDPVTGTRLLRESARSLRMALLEGWGERLGSMGREWTRFERMAARHGESALARRVAALAGADVAGAASRASAAPAWLAERIELCYGARIAVGEEVSADENARDQLVAYALHVERHRPDLDGPWTGTPSSALGAQVAELRELLG